MDFLVACKKAQLAMCGLGASGQLKLPLTVKRSPLLSLGGAVKDWRFYWVSTFARGEVYIAWVIYLLEQPKTNHE